MKILITTAIAAVVLLDLLIAYSCCVVASRADRDAERMMAEQADEGNTSGEMEG